MTNQTVTVHIAPSGNPLSDGTTSITGHMWFTLTDALGNERSYGFAPRGDGDPWGPGEVKLTDDRHYVNPPYNYTREITEEQFIKMESFAEKAQQQANDGTGRWEEYSGVWNSCVDFTWEALNQAGLTDTPEDGWQGNLLPWFNRWNVEKNFMHQDPFEKWWDKVKDAVSDAFNTFTRYPQRSDPFTLDLRQWPGNKSESMPPLP